jgi:hypothetical protein
MCPIDAPAKCPRRCRRRSPPGRESPRHHRRPAPRLQHDRQPDPGPPSVDQ